MASSLSSSPKSVVSPSKSKKDIYKWLLIGLLVVLGLFLVFSLLKKKEGFENGAGTLFYFFMPECGHCKKFNPEWEKLQKLVDDNRTAVKLNKIDGTDDVNKDLVSQYGVQGFPTLILEIGGKSNKYEGERTAEAVQKWVSDLLIK